MRRTDAYVAMAVLAWLAGAYYVGEGLRAQAAAIDRQTLAMYCTTGFIGEDSGGLELEQCIVASLRLHDHYLAE